MQISDGMILTSTSFILNFSNTLLIHSKSQSTEDWFNVTIVEILQTINLGKDLDVQLTKPNANVKGGVGSLKL